MRNALGVLALGGASLLSACAAPQQTTTAALELQSLPSCELPPGGGVTLRASGDFATQELNFAASMALDDDRFPPGTRVLAFEVGEAGARAGGLLTLSGDDVRQALWILPFGRSCPLGDPLAVASEGAAVAPLADGGLLIAGGRGADGAASADATVLAPGAPLTAAVADGMLFKRSDATATPVADGVLIVGGADDDYGREVERMQMRSAHDTFELFVAALGRFDTARSGKLAAGPRRDHAALALRDGRVLVVGGVRALGTEALPSAELIDVEEHRAHETDGALALARVRPALLALDSGAVLVALGGADAGADAGAEQGALVREVERFDPQRERFETVTARLPDHPQAAVAALEGDRVVYVGCDDKDVACEVALLVPDGDDFALVTPDFSAAPLHDDPDGLRRLSQLRLLALHDGRVLVTGRSARGGTTRRGFVLDLNALAIDRAELSRVPDALIELADGSRVEADPLRLSLARDDVQSPFDDAPSKLIEPGQTALALDAAKRWTQEDGGLHALSAARADLPRLRFASVRIEIDARGDAELSLEADRDTPTVVALRGGRVALGDCTLDRAADDAVVIERRGERVTLRSGKRAHTCSAPALGERIGIALRAAAETRILALHVERL